MSFSLKLGAQSFQNDYSSQMEYLNVLVYDFTLLISNPDNYINFNLKYRKIEEKYAIIEINNIFVVSSQNRKRQA